MTAESIRRALRPFEESYLRRFDSLSNDSVPVDPICFAAVGKNYPKAHLRVLLIGRATAGWEIEEDNAIPVSYTDRLKERHEISDDYLHRGGRHSAFWRLANRLNETAYSYGKPNEIDSASHSLSLVSWSNLFKIGAHKKNPNIGLQNRQYDEALALLRTEVTAFEPHLVVFATEPFGDNFVYEALHLTRGNDGLTVQKDLRKDFCYRHWTAVNSPAILWVQHPERKQNSRIERWLAKADELLHECDKVRSQCS